MNSLAIVKSSASCIRSVEMGKGIMIVIRNSYKEECLKQERLRSFYPCSCAYNRASRTFTQGQADIATVLRYKEAQD